MLYPNMNSLLEDAMADLQTILMVLRFKLLA